MTALKKTFQPNELYFKWGDYFNQILFKNKTVFMTTGFTPDEAVAEMVEQLKLFSQTQTFPKITPKSDQPVKNEQIKVSKLVVNLKDNEPTLIECYEKGN